MKGSKPITRSINCGFGWWSFSYLSFLSCACLFTFSPLTSLLDIFCCCYCELLCGVFIIDWLATTTGCYIILSHNHLFYHLSDQLPVCIIQLTNQPLPSPASSWSAYPFMNLLFFIFHLNWIISPFCVSRIPKVT